LKISTYPIGLQRDVSVNQRVNQDKEFCIYGYVTGYLKYHLL